MMSSEESLREFGWDCAVMEKDEIKLILDFLNDQYISYENVPLIKLVREMREWYESQS